MTTMRAWCMWFQFFGGVICCQSVLYSKSKGDNEEGDWNQAHPFPRFSGYKREGVTLRRWRVGKVFFTFSFSKKDRTHDFIPHWGAPRITPTCTVLDLRKGSPAYFLNLDPCMLKRKSAGSRLLYDEFYSYASHAAGQNNILMHGDL